MGRTGAKEPAGVGGAAGAAGTSAVTVGAGLTGEYRVVPLAQLLESPHNPRKHFDAAALEELTASIRTSGIWEPLVVRPHATRADHYELASGHRRFRAATRAGLVEVPVFVKHLDDAAFMELLTVANLQRENVHPLEEADAYAEMIKTLAWDVPTIAQKVSKGETYVYDRLKLRSLIPAVRDLFFANRISAAHAIELTRIDSEAQARAIDPESDRSGLWRHDVEEHDPRQDELALDEARGADPYFGLTVRTVKELKAWIHDRVRFDVAAADPVLFPEVVQAVQQAEAARLKVVSITYDYHVQEEARAEGERTFGPRSWKRADGQEDSRVCETEKSLAKRALGVIVVGPGQGESFTVCLEKDGCRTHWGAEQKEKAKRAKAAAGAAKSTTPREQPWERERRLRDEFAARAKPAIPFIAEAFAAAVRKASAGANGPLAAMLNPEKPHGPHGGKIGRGKSAEDLVRYLVWADVCRGLNNEYQLQSALPRLGKQLGVDVAKLLKAHAPAAEKPVAKVSTAAKSGGKTSAKKKRAA